MIFFDFDGVLLDSNDVWTQVDLVFAERRGLAVTEEYMYAMGHSIFPTAARFAKDYYQLPETPEEIMAEWKALAYDAYAHTIPLKEGALELLERYRQAGERVVLLTAGLPELARAAFDRHELAPYFEDLFFAHEVGLEKRDPEVYRVAAKRYGVAPANCVLYEDAPYNCAAARQAGFTVVGVYDDFYQNVWEDVVKNSHRAVRSLNELL